MSALHLTLEVPMEVPRQSRKATALSKAEERVLRKAAAQPIHRTGAFSGGSDVEQLWRSPRFDRPLMVDRCIARRLITPTEFFNQYSITDAGREKLARLDELRSRRAEKVASR